MEGDAKAKILKVNHQILTMSRDLLTHTKTRMIEQLPSETMLRCVRYSEYIQSRGFKVTIDSDQLIIHHSGRHIYDPNTISCDEIITDMLNLISILMIIDWDNYKCGVLKTHQNPEDLAINLIKNLSIKPGVGRFPVMSGSKYMWLLNQMESVKLIMRCTHTNL